jgi:diguanylate cyclase (GGDEF)-like protein
MALGFAGPAPALRAAPTEPNELAPPPSAKAFDALLRRLDYGDLLEVSTARQREALTELEKLLPPGDAHRRRLLDSEHCLLDFQDAMKDGYAYADAHLREAMEAKDVEATARFHYCRGSFEESLNAPQVALADYDHGIQLARVANDDPLLASGLQLRGGVYSLLGVHGKALADLLEAQHIFLQNELSEAAEQTFLAIGIAYRRLGELDKAREFLNQSIEHQRRVGDRESLFISLVQRGYTEEESGHYEAALADQQRALAVANDTGDRYDIAAAQLALASALNALHRYAEALEALKSAEAGFSAVDNVADQGMVAFERGRALAGLEQHAKALENYARAEAAFDKSGNTRYQEMLHQAKAQSLEASGQPAAALEEFKRYLKLHDEVQRQRADQHAQMLREQFDSDRAKLENAHLRAEQALKDKQVENLQRVRRWQQAAMGLLAALIGLLALLVVRQLARLRNWKRMASLDPLTGVANRRGVEQFAARAIRRARVGRETLAVLAIDVDEFKRINDTLGHAAGDKVLHIIARTCQESLREGDFLGRIGGEEFLVLLPRSSGAHAIDIAERLRRRVGELSFAEIDPSLRVTISIGVAELTAHDASFADLERRADAALYRAKAEGRNRVVLTGIRTTDPARNEAATPPRPAQPG